MQTWIQLPGAGPHAVTGEAGCYYSISPGNTTSQCLWQSLSDPFAMHFCTLNRDVSVWFCFVLQNSPVRYFKSGKLQDWILGCLHVQLVLKHFCKKWCSQLRELLIWIHFDLLSWSLEPWPVIAVVAVGSFSVMPLVLVKRYLGHFCQFLCFQSNNLNA